MRVVCLANLCTALGKRSSCSRSVSDIAEAIDLLMGTRLRDSELPRAIQMNMLDTLGKLLQSRFARCQDCTDIDTAIALHREVVQMRPSLQPWRTQALESLGDAILHRFQFYRDLQDINEAITLLEEVLQAHPVPNLNRLRVLNSLANSYLVRFEACGNVEDIDAAVRLLREGLEVVFAPHLHNIFLSNLGAALRWRFAERRDPNDLSEAIYSYQRALEIGAPSDQRRAEVLHNLAVALKARYEDQGDPRDIEMAVKLHREEVKIGHDLNPGSPLNSLGNALQTRFEHHGDIADLDESIIHFREALELRPEPHPFRTSSLNNLAGALQQRFHLKSNSADIDEAVQLVEDALKLTPRDHPRRGTLYETLGTSLHYKALSQKSDEDSVSRSILHLRNAATFTSSTAFQRFNSARRWAEVANRLGHRSCLEAYRTAIGLLPQLVSFSSDIKVRRKILSGADFAGLGTSSAICAIRFNALNAAVEYLEESRFVFWALALRLRTPLKELAAVNGGLAERLRKTSQQLEQTSFRDQDGEIFPAGQAQARKIEAEAARCRELANEWEATVKEIREIPKFSEFLHPKRMEALDQAAKYGPIVMLLAGKSLCLGLILKGSKKVEHVPLSGLDSGIVAIYAQLLRAGLKEDIHLPDFFNGRTIDKSEESTWRHRLFGRRENSDTMSSEDILRAILADLWISIVRPVLKALRLKASKCEDPPRLWWCPTGQLAFLPIHAAGVYDPGHTDCVADYAVSSYTPTIGSLLKTQIGHCTSSPFKMTVIIEPHAEGCSTLPGTAKELDGIERTVGKTRMVALRSPTASEALKSLANSSVVHFACHGIQDARDPLDSGLLLADGRLKVSQIMRGVEQEDGTRAGARDEFSLAYLSACETVKGDDGTPDEAMHLAASLIFAGFHGVVATMWTMCDDDGPAVAVAFYEHLLGQCTPERAARADLTNAAKALHVAVGKLREKENMTFKRWVPFVHFGM
ncbi:CHAT domain-containing protein [Mycena venus]|uniref:CHAT domain-containing protein n=1 Tax=Mycena venus TaxID=2733690 RepID=A0A8H6YFC8_9AGAR|nr:CHAT domain-containing protein [Mycena venus]